MPIVSGGGGGAAGALARLATTVLAAPAANFDFTAIPATSNSLVVVGILRGTTAAINTSAAMIFNNDSTASYDRMDINAVGPTIVTAPVSASTSVFLVSATAATATAGDFGVFHLVIPFYATTGANKIAVSTTGAFATQGTTATYGQDQVCQQWRNTAAISRITITPGAGNWDIGSAVTIYGLS